MNQAKWNKAMATAGNYSWIGSYVPPKQKWDRASILVLTVEPVCIADNDDFYSWMVQHLNTTPGPSSANVSTAGGLPGPTHRPA
jgi:hypothetical protein